MSYGLYKYIVAKELSGDTGSVEFRIELWKKSYSGSTEQLEGAGSYFDHNYTKINSRNPFNKPVNDSDLSLYFHVQNSSHLALLTEIQNADEDEFLLKKKVDGSYDWQGKVVNDLLEYDEGDYPFTGKITAKDLTFLKGQEYTLATGYEKIIVTLADVLGDLGFGIGFKTHTNWVENNSTTSDDFLNQVYHDKFAFRKYATSTTVDDQPITKYQVLERICRNHQLILRQVSGQWYIYQLSELSDPTSLNIFSYNSSGTQTGTTTQDITTDIDDSDLYSLPSGSNKINPAIKKASVVFDHRTGTTEQFVNAVVLSSLTDPAIPNARFSMNFNGSGDEYVIVQGGTYAICSRNYQFNNEEFPQSAYLLKSSQYYWIEEAQEWQEVADITTTRESVAPGNIDTGNNKIRLVSNDFRHGDVIRLESGFTTGTDADTEYYLIDVSGEVATGSDTLYYQISTEPDGTPVSLGSVSGSNKYAYRVSNRQQMTNRTVPFGGTVWWCDFSFTTSTIPSDSDSDVQFYAMGSVMPPITTDVAEDQYWEYVDSTNQWRDLSVSVRDVVTSNGDSITYELEQSGNFSTELSYDSVYFGDGPLDYSRSALAITTTTTADTPTSQWDFRGGSTNSNFFKIWLKEVLDFQRGNRRNLSANLYGFYDGYQVLSYESKYFFFLGGTHTGRGNIWSGDWIEINIATGTDTFTSYVDATNSVGSGGGTGGGAPSTSEGTYLEVANNLSDVESASTSRTNLGLEIGVDVQAHDDQLDTLSGLSAGQADDIVAITEAEYTQIQNIDSVTISNTQWGYIGALDQNLTTTSDVQFDDITATGVIITDEIDTTSITWNVSTQVWDADPSEKFNNPVYISTSLDVDNGINADQHIHAGTYLKADTYLEVGTSATIGTTLDVGTNATVGGTLDVTGATTLSTLDVSGNTTVGGTLNVTGNTTISGTLDALTLNTGQGDNELYAMNQDVQTTDGVIFDTLSVTNNASVGGSLTLTGEADFNSTMNLQGDLTTQADLKDDGYSPSWSGSNWQIQADGTAEFQELFVRGALTVFEFIAKQISTIGGSEILSIAQGKIDTVTPGSGAISFENTGGAPGISFKAGDLWICQVTSINQDKQSGGSGVIVKSVTGQVSLTSGNSIITSVTSGSLNDLAKGDLVVVYGNVGTDANAKARQAIMYRNVDRSVDSLIMRMQTGVDTFSKLQDEANTRVAFGDLGPRPSLSTGYSGLTEEIFGFFAGDNSAEHILIHAGNNDDIDGGLFLKDGTSTLAQLTSNTFKVGDSTNFLSFDGTTFDIQTDTFNLDTTNLVIDSANQRILVGSESSGVRLGDLGSGLKGLKINSSGVTDQNYWLLGSGNVSFRVGNGTNFLNFDEVTGSFDIETEQFTLDTTDSGAERGIKIDSSSQEIELYDDNKVRTVIDINSGGYTLTETTHHNAGLNTIVTQTTTPYETSVFAIDEGDSLYVDVEAKLSFTGSGTPDPSPSFYIEGQIYGGTSGTATNLVANFLGTDCVSINDLSRVTFSAFNYSYTHYKVKIVVNGNNTSNDARFTLTSNLLFRSADSRSRFGLDGLYIDSSNEQYARLTREENKLSGITKLVNIPSTKPIEPNVVYKDSNGFLKIS